MTPTSNSRADAGFSLVELLVALALMALVTTLVLFAAPRGSPHDRPPGEKVLAQLAQARRAAIAHRRVTFVTVKADDAASEAHIFRFYPDGSSNGGAIRLSPHELVEVDILGGRARVLP
ncbi:prepilin-type N-terminal cleavage/methylation domain-containing protein [Sphingomicrobium arenosum]|uniref:prepilin-type N-terminal cleavage/methylation domain-containing protein n=1 Tax=Sphingomicrobium arenosum TaxID=2233861 RepID=UPI002240F99D|nr:prepilin-type N-terminal cleavage/methylation domain-containing protein [Sphingomicrobium arenosum]